MTKKDIATVLEKIATLLELKDENPFKVRAYTNAARAIETFGETTQQKLCDAVARRAAHAGSFQFGQVAAEAESMRADLAAHESALQVDVAGSYRRRKEIVHDLDLLVATNEPEGIAKFFVSH